MSEKLSAFAALYAEKAAADVEKQKENVAKSEEKLKRATELWEALKIETEKLGIFEKFTSVFPQPGGGVVATDGVSANPNLTTLLSYGDPLESSVRELLKLKNAKERLDNTKTALAYAEGLVARKPEDHINMLGHELVKLAAKSASGGGNTIDSLLKSFFSTYESFKEIMEYEINDVSGPKTVDTSQESYAVLNEKFEAGELFKSEKKEDTASPINEQSTEPATTKSPTESGINAADGVQGGTTEKTTGESATVTEGKPEVMKTEGAVQGEATINLNLEKKEDASNLGPVATEPSAVMGPINQPAAEQSPAASVEAPAPSVTQQNINLTDSTQTNVSSPTTNATQAVSETVNAQNIASSSTINQSTLESKSGGPKFLDKVKAAAGRALSPIGEKLMSDGKDLLGVAGSQLERMGIPINLLGKAAERIRERKKEKSELGVTNSAINSATNNTQSTTNVDGSESSTTSNTSLTQSNITNPIESNVEKLNPSVAGNPTTAQPEPKTDVAISQPTAPVTPTQSSPSMAEVKPQKPLSLSPTNQPAASQAPPMIDVASLENRLKRIEQALTNPLEVIIKES